MYIKIEEKNKIGGYSITEKYFAYTYSNDNVRSKLEVVKHDPHQLIFESREDKVNRFHLFEDILGYVSRKEEVTHLINLKKLDSIVVNTVLYDLFPNTQSIYGNLYYNLSEIDNNAIYDLSTGEIVRVVDTKIIGFIVLNTFNFLVTKKDSYIYIYSKTDFSLLWQQNFSKIAKYQEIDGEYVTGEVREVYSYKDSLIILTQLFIFRIGIQTGEILYQQKLPAGFMSLSIHKNKAYSCYGYHSIEIDLDTMKIDSFHRIEYENYEGKPHFTIMNHPVYHEGLVFHAVRLEGGLHCVGAIYPETGKRVWIQPIGVYDINSIAFHEDKMYVHDTASALHIFKREFNKINNV